MDVKSLFENDDTVVPFRAGSSIFEEGKTGTVMYVVLDGQVEIRKGARVIETLGPGSILGEMSLIAGPKRSASAVAASDCRLASVDERRFLALVREYPFFALHVMRALADRLRRMNDLLTP